MYKTEIITIVRNFSTSNALGIDGFSIKTIKTIIPYIAEQVADIFNKSIVNEVFPDSLKHAKITPVSKLKTNVW